MLPRVEPERHCRTECKCRVLAPIIIERRIAHLDGAVRHGVEHLQTGHKFTGGKRLNLKAIVGDFGQLAVSRHFTSGIDCAIAGAATALAARPTPPAFRNSRRFMRFLLCFMSIPRRGDNDLKCRFSLSSTDDVEIGTQSSDPENKARFGSIEI